MNQMYRRQSLLLAALLLLASLPASAQFKRFSNHKNTDEGFALRVPSKWDAIPPQPSEIEIVAKWAMDNKRGGYNSYEMQIMRFEPKGGTTGDEKNVGLPGLEEKEGQSRADRMRAFREAYRPTSFEQWFERNYRGDAKLPEPETLKLKKKGLTGKLYTIPNWLDQGLWKISALIGVYSDGTYEWVVLYKVNRDAVIDPKRPKSKTAGKSSILKSLSSFHLIKKKERKLDFDPADNELLAKVYAQAKRGLPKDWEIRPTKSKNYVVVHNIPRKKTKQLVFVSDILKHLDRIRKIYEELFPPRKEITAVSIVRICRDKEEYHQYGGPGGSAGYWNAGDEELVIYDASKSGGKKDSFSTLFHEAFHQYIYYAMGEVSPHSWYNEGFGDYFAGANPKRSYKIEPFKWRTGTVRAAVATGEAHHLRDLVNFEQSQYYSLNPGMCYAQGWALVYFLNHKKTKKHPVWGGILQRYFDKLIETGNKKQANEHAFENVDFDELNDAYHAFIKKGFK